MCLLLETHFYVQQKLGHFNYSFILLEQDRRTEKLKRLPRYCWQRINKLGSHHLEKDSRNETKLLPTTAQTTIKYTRKKSGEINFDCKQLKEWLNNMNDIQEHEVE